MPVDKATPSMMHYVNESLDGFLNVYRDVISVQDFLGNVILLVTFISVLVISFLFIKSLKKRLKIKEIKIPRRYPALIVTIWVVMFLIFSIVPRFVMLDIQKVKENTSIEKSMGRLFK